MRSASHGLRGFLDDSSSSNSTARDVADDDDADAPALPPRGGGPRSGVLAPAAASTLRSRDTSLRRFRLNADALGFATEDSGVPPTSDDTYDHMVHRPPPPPPQPGTEEPPLPRLPPPLPSSPVPPLPRLTGSAGISSATPGAAAASFFQPPPPLPATLPPPLPSSRPPPPRPPHNFQEEGEELLEAPMPPPRRTNLTYDTVFDDEDAARLAAYENEAAMAIAAEPPGTYTVTEPADKPAIEIAPPRTGTDSFHGQHPPLAFGWHPHDVELADSPGDYVNAAASLPQFAFAAATKLPPPGQPYLGPRFVRSPSWRRQCLLRFLVAFVLVLVVALAAAVAALATRKCSNDPAPYYMAGTAGNSTGPAA